MRTVTDHKLNGLNDALEITVLDEPGQGGACHAYAITHKTELGHQEFTRIEFHALKNAVDETLEENRHLADGDNCTLKKLKDAYAKAKNAGHGLDSENAKVVAPPPQDSDSK